MMPQLQAEEKLDAINISALGSGQVENQYRMRAIDRLKRKALGKRYRAKKATMRDLAGMGIGVRVTASSSEAVGNIDPAPEGSGKGLSDG